jgi:hypothetical protein
MKKIFVLLMGLLSVAVVQAQTVLACQFTESGGYIYRNGRWQLTSFTLDKPFFIRLQADGVIDPSSLAGAGMTYNIECSRPYSHRPEFVRCAGNSDMMIFSTRTLAGSTSALHGAASEGGNRDTLSINPFTCQRM